jgi:predicted GNAT family N-acyltransferase
MINNDQKTMPYIEGASESSIVIGIAITPEEKKEIYRFRYQTYVEEMSKHLNDIDSVNRLLHDELDEWTILLSAKIGSKIIATIRLNIGTLEDFPRKLTLILSLDDFQDSYSESSDHKFALITKVMVAPSHRSSPALYLLIVKCYELCDKYGVQFGFGACNVHLLRLYEQMGFHRYNKNFIDPGYGLLIPIVMLADDRQHFHAVNSPLFRIARRKKGVINSQAVKWFHEKFIRNSPNINSKIITAEELWSILCKGLHCSPMKAITLLRELTDTEAKTFLHSCSSLVHCDTGDMITTQGDISYSYNILISGKLKSLTFQYPIKEYTLPGQHFGANGLTEHNKNTEDIVAVTSVQILVLSGMAFPRFFHSHPDIAHKIVQTMRSLTNNPLNKQ